MVGPELNRQSPPEVVEEQRLLDLVLDTIRRQPLAPRQRNYRAEYIQLRDSLDEEKLWEDQASIVEQMHRLSRLAAAQTQALRNPIDPLKPYFGHLLLEDRAGRRRTVLIGRTTFIADDVTIVDWRDAPISRIFYECDEGDEYELDIAGREVHGQVLLRRTVSIQNGELLRVSDREHAWVVTDVGWVDAHEVRPALRGGQGSASRPDRTRPVIGMKGKVPSLGPAHSLRADKHLPEIASLLDSEQFKLITRPDGGLVAIQGTAGSGKTTVALHRVAYLAFNDPKRFDPRRSMVVVFNRALASYISQILPALGVRGVPVHTYDHWAREIRRRLYPGLPPGYASDTPALVSRAKQHSALVPMLQEAARQNPKETVPDLFEELFTSRSWLVEGFSRHAPGIFSDSELERVHQWCVRQTFTRMDGEGANEEDVPVLDVEDDTILLRLHQLLRGPLVDRKNQPIRYAHLVVDEVQDLSPLEISVLMGSVAPGHPVTLAGDIAQKVVEESDFTSWQDVLGVLDLAHVQVSLLKVSYRSTRNIVELAQAVLGPLAPEEPPEASREGAPVELFAFPGWGEATTFLADALRDLSEAEPMANCAILVRTRERALEIFQSLARVSLRSFRLVSDQDFSFAPGIEVTDIRQVKGLEFDYVIIADCDEHTYPKNPPSRHLLHVGITRAAHQVWLLSVGEPSQVLPDWLKPTRVL